MDRAAYRIKSTEPLPFAALLAAALLLSAAPASAASPTGDAAEPGFRVDFSSGGRFAPSYDASVNFLPAWGFDATAGIEYAMAKWIPLRAELGIFSIGASGWDDSLFRFRAFWGYRLAALTGARFDVGPGEISLLAGAAISASRFTGLNQVTAFASAVGEIRYKAPVTLPFFGGIGFDAIASLSIEYSFRGSARTLSAGLDLGIGIALPKTRAK